MSHFTADSSSPYKCSPFKVATPKFRSLSLSRNFLGQSILNIAKAVIKPSLISINEKEFKNYLKKSKFVEFDFTKVKNDTFEIVKALKIYSLWNKAEFICFIISHSNKFGLFDISEVMYTAKKYFNNYQIASFEDDSLNNEIGLGFYKVY